MIRRLFGRTLVRYLFVGGLSYLIEIGSLYYMSAVLGIEPLWSVAISFWVGFVVAYVLQKVITFQNREHTKKAIATQLVSYSLLVAWNYAFTLVAVGLCEQFTSVVVIRTIVIIITTMWNFFIYQRIFAQREVK